MSVTQALQLDLAQMQQFMECTQIAQITAYFPLDTQSLTSRGLVHESFCGIEQGHLGIDRQKRL